jgi:hypothetical protein
LIGKLIIDDILDGEVGTYGTDLFLGFQPEAPDSQIVVFEETAPVLDESQGFNIDSIGIQLISRDKDYETAKANLKAAHLLIAGYRGTLSDGTKVRETYIVTPPSSIGSDKRNRKEFTAHYKMNYTQTATSLRPQV